MPLPHRLTLHAHAKINLALSVGPPEPPKGYHQIASWFVPIGLHDDVTVERLETGESSRHEVRWAAGVPGPPRPTPIDWPLEKDLAVRAHRLLERHVGRELPTAITVEKRTRVGGGLGGGSSDAAAAMAGVNRVHGLGLTADKLRELSVQLGSDIAFFLDDGVVLGCAGVASPAMVSGFGDRIERVDPVRGEVLLFFPPFGCATGPVYKAFDAQPRQRLDALRVRGLIAAAWRNGAIDTRGLFNDLGEPACVVEPRLRVMWSGLQRACGEDAIVHLTGSGSTLFAIVPPDRAESVENACRAAVSDVVIVRTTLIGG
jgi:4-diphosphocytidyl-2-C-methyl-D-erythritol kinase